MDTQIIVRTSNDLLERFRAFAASKDVSMSELIREFMDSVAREDAS